MSLGCLDAELLIGEHHLLIRCYGRAQDRCSLLLKNQSAEIEGLRSEAMRLRAAVIVRDSALAWAHEDRRIADHAIPDLPKRVAHQPVATT